jgi:hypothetical protein
LLFVLRGGLGFAKVIFWGKGFGKTSANFCPPAERGLGNECGRASVSDFFGGGYFFINSLIASSTPPTVKSCIGIIAFAACIVPELSRSSHSF